MDAVLDKEVDAVALPVDVAACHAMILQLLGEQRDQSRLVRQMQHQLEQLLRKLYGRSSEKIAHQLEERFRNEIDDAVVGVYGAPPVDGLGTAGGFKIVIEDREHLWRSMLDAMGKLHRFDVAMHAPYLSEGRWGVALDTDPALESVRQWREFTIWACEYL